MPMTRFGLQLWSQQTDWPGFRDAALAAEAAGWDSIWTWDHLMAIFGPWEQPIFEGWSVLAGLGAGDLAGPARVDGRREHVPQSRADRQARHDARQHLGRPGRARHRRRLVRARARRLRDRVLRQPGRTARPARRVGHAHAPAARRRAVQPRGPLLHDARRAVRAASDPGAAADPGRRLRAAQDAPDRRPAGRRLEHERARSTRSAARSTSSPSIARTSVATSPTIEKTISFPIVLRDDRAAAEAAYGALMAHNGVESMGSSIALLGAPTEVADAIRPYLALGFATVIVRMPAPYDRETIDRMAEVQELLGRVKVVALAGGTGGAKLAEGLQAVLPPRRSDGRRQHRRRHGAARPAGDARPRRGHVHAGRPVRPRARLGPSPARRGP